MDPYYIISFLPGVPSVWGRFAGRLLSGVLGILLVFIFFAGFMQAGRIVRYLPFIIGFNAMISGFSFLDKTSGMLKRKKIAAMVLGSVIGLVSSLLLNLIAGTIYGAGIIYFSDLVIFILVSLFCSLLGAILSMHHRSLKERFLDGDGS